jgi:hypothetical protein
VVSSFQVYLPKFYMHFSTLLCVNMTKKKIMSKMNVMSKIVYHDEKEPEDETRLQNFK